MILAGDIGGTKIRLALYSSQNRELCPIEIESFVSSDFSHLEEIFHIFSAKHEGCVRNACFGVSGPVLSGQAQTTKLPWTVDEDKIRRVFGFGSVKPVNDLVATAAAVPFLTSRQLNKGKEH